jgi:hypothetical protein
MVRTIAASPVRKDRTGTGAQNAATSPARTGACGSWPRWIPGVSRDEAQRITDVAERFLAAIETLLRT